MAKEYAVTHTDAEWRKLLTPEQYQIMRNHGTEMPGSCTLLHEKRAGTLGALRAISRCSRPSSVRKRYRLAELQRSDLRRGRGETDRSHGMIRDEVHCSRCGSHLGHVFNTGRRRPTCATASTALR